MKRHQKILVASLAVAAASWVVPTLGWLTLPLRYLYTLLHEIGHALAAAITGAYDISIQIALDGSGVTWSRGGHLLVVAPAGYIGATAMGAAMLWVAKTPQGATNALRTMAITLGIAWLVWVRFDPLGMALCLVFGFLTWMIAIRATGETLLFAAQFLGAFLCLASLQAVLGVVGMLGLPIENDAVILEKATGIPAAFSALLWAAMSVVAVGVGLRHAWKD